MANLSPIGISVILGRYTALLINEGLIAMTGSFMRLEEVSEQFAREMSRIDVEEHGRITAKELETNPNPPSEEVDKMIKSIINPNHN